jgi:hypothetical protein
MLPDEVRPADLPDPAGDAGPGVAVALEEHGLAPLRLDLLGADQHLLVLGDGECGKTNLLRALVQRLTARHPPEDVRIARVDQRRQLVDALPAAHLAGLACAPGMLAGLVDGLAAELSARLPGAEPPVERWGGEPGQARSWSWSSTTTTWSRAQGRARWPAWSTCSPTAATSASTWCSRAARPGSRAAATSRSSSAYASWGRPRSS